MISFHVDQVVVAVTFCCNEQLSLEILCTTASSGSLEIDEHCRCVLHKRCCRGRRGPVRQKLSEGIPILSRPIT
jgi:hypothetical protein